jgi:hypothetical protein
MAAVVSGRLPLTKLVNRWPMAQIDELMPWTYAKITRPAVDV